MQPYSAVALSFFVCLYSLLGIVIRHQPFLSKIQKKIAKNSKANFAWLVLLIIPALFVFWAGQFYWMAGYLLAFVLLGVFYRSLGTAYRDFWVIQTPILLYGAGHLVFYFPSLFTTRLYSLESLVVLSAASALIMQHVLGINEKSALQQKFHHQTFNKTSVATLLIAGSVVFLVGELSGWFWQAPSQHFAYWAPLFLWTQFVFVQEHFSKVGFFYSVQAAFRMHDYSAIFISGCFSAVYWFALTQAGTASLLGFAVGVATATVYSMQGPFLSLVFHSLLFLLSYLFFSLPL